MTAPLASEYQELFAGFEVTDKGKEKIEKLTTAYNELLNLIWVLSDENIKTREYSLTRTKLEESCMFAKKHLSHLNNI